MDDTVLSEEMQRERGIDVDLSRNALHAVNVDTEHEEIIKADPFTNIYKIVENVPELATQDPRATKDKVSYVPTGLLIQAWVRSPSHANSNSPLTYTFPPPPNFSVRFVC